MADMGAAVDAIVAKWERDGWTYAENSRGCAADALQALADAGYIVSALDGEDPHVVFEGRTQRVSLTAERQAAPANEPFQRIRRAAAIAGGWGWCEEHGESFKDHDHAPEFDGILERDGFGPSVHDDDFEWEK